MIENHIRSEHEINFSAVAKTTLPLSPLRASVASSIRANAEAVPALPLAVLEQTAGDGLGKSKGRQAAKKGGGMTLENIADYSAAHRTRERRENGYVRLTGTREKKWCGYYHVYPNGKRIKRSRIIGTKADIPTKAEAEDLHRTWLRRQASQPVADSGRATVAALCDDYLALKKGDWDIGTWKTNDSLFNRTIKAALGTRLVENVTSDELKLFVNSLPDRQYTTPGCVKRINRKLVKVPGKVKTGISIFYARKVITHLRAIFDLATERDLIRKNPARSISTKLRTPKRAKKANKSVFPPQYLAALIDQLAPRDKLIVWLSILGATRPNELFAVRGSDVGPGWVAIQRALDRYRNVKETKTAKSRLIHLPPVLAAEVAAYMKRQKIRPLDLLFPNKDGKPLDRKNYLNRKLRPAARRAKIPTLDVDFRMLRRSFATVAQFVGLDVKAIQSQLGHSKPDMTMTEYMQPIDARTADQMRQLEDILRGRVPMPLDVTAKIGVIQ